MQYMRAIFLPKFQNVFPTDPPPGDLQLQEPVRHGAPLTPNTDYAPAHAGWRRPRPGL